MGKRSYADTCNGQCTYLAELRARIKESEAQLAEGNALLTRIYVASLRHEMWEPGMPLDAAIGVRAYLASCGAEPALDRALAGKEENGE